MSLDPAQIGAAFRAACLAEIDTLKPGNVHRFAPGHGMTAETFETAADAAAPALASRGQPVGKRILAATRASFGAVGVNANLGIVLLCAPLAAAAERADAIAFETEEDGADALHEAVRTVLDDLDESDAIAAFAAIAWASPGGLGNRPKHDVRAAPTIGLVDAMALAADADLVARQYVNGFADVFEVGLAAINSSAYPEESCLGNGRALSAFLAFASRYPDSHIARKFGTVAAADCREGFREFSKTLNDLSDWDERLALARTFDRELKLNSLNPGTSADLTVASLFVKKLAQALSG